MKSRYDFEDLDAMVKEKKLSEAKTDEWAITLVTTLEQPNHLDSVDASKHLSTSDIYYGYEYYTLYKAGGERDKELLAFACHLGYFSAYLERIDENAEIIKNKNEQFSPKEVEAAEDELLEDINEFGQLYWSVGYILSSQNLLDIGDHFADKQEEGKARNFYEKSAKNYYKGKTLFNLPQSKELHEVIYHNEGICGWTDFQEADKVVLSHLSNKDRSKLLEESRKEIEVMLEKNDSVKIRKK